MSKSINRNSKCWCGSGFKYKKCHSLFDEKLKWFIDQGYVVPDNSLILNKSQIDGVKESGVLNSTLLDYISDKLHIGMSTEEIDQVIYRETIRLGGLPATLNYNGYPKSLCTSINDQVCHGIPSEKVKLKDGDILNIDVSTIYNGYYSDSARVFCIGNVNEEERTLVEVAKESIDVGLSKVIPWTSMRHIGEAISKFATAHDYRIAQNIGGHGIGLKFHEEPYVSYNKKGTDLLLVPGMVFTIEPAVNMGTGEVFENANNGWTIYTEDQKPSAQWEVTVLVTDSGYEIIAN